MKLRFHVQPSIVVFYRSEDSGEWVLSCCRLGFQQAVGRRLRIGDQGEIEMDVKLLTCENKRLAK